MVFRTLFPFPCNNDYTCHPPFSLARHLSRTDLRAELWVMQRGPRARAPFVRALCSHTVHSLIVRVNKTIQPKRDWARQIIEGRYARVCRAGDVAHVYRGCSLDLLRALRARGTVVILERVNTMDHMAKRIMEDAYARAGWSMEFPFTQRQLDLEQAEADAANFIFSPSPAVTESLRERGIPEERILQCSYGWDPQRFTAPARALPDIEGVTVLFVGYIGMRKGAHLLLDAWSRAGIDGRLVLLGHMDPVIAKHCADHLRRMDVIHLAYRPDAAPVYRSSDIFAFPTLEEGSPLVSYEAMGNGLPVVISPMGAGSVIRHRQDGLVIDPYDQEAWIAALRALAADPGMRRALGEAGRVRSADYTWDKVAQRRYDLIKGALTQHSRSSP